MKPQIHSADASFYFRESAGADSARMDTSAVYGNIADAMKNAVVLLPTAQPLSEVAGETSESGKEVLG